MAALPYAADNGLECELPLVHQGSVASVNLAAVAVSSDLESHLCDAAFEMAHALAAASESAHRYAAHHSMGDFFARIFFAPWLGYLGPSDTEFYEG